MFERYQRRADSLPGRMLSADDITTDQPYNPGDPYQAVANRGSTSVARHDDPRVPHFPVEIMREGDQLIANSGPTQMMSSDDIKLGRIGRRSGSLMRSVRGLGDAEQTTVVMNCIGFQPDEWVPPVMGYTLDQLEQGTLDVNVMANVFGVRETACVDSYLQSRLAAAGSTCTGSDAQKMMCAIAVVLAELGQNPTRLQNAAKRMRERGWWTSSHWHFYWCYLSGSKPVYANPFAYGVAGLVGLASYFGYKKWWR